jgi:hypothetical protein
MVRRPPEGVSAADADAFAGTVVAEDASSNLLSVFTPSLGVALMGPEKDGGGGMGF